MSTPSSMVGEQNSAGRKTFGSPTRRSCSFASARFARSSSPQRKRHSRHSRRVRIDLRGMFAALNAEQGLAAARKRVREGAVKVHEIGIGGLSVLAAVRRDQTNGIRGKSPAIDIEARRHRSDQLILRGSGEQGGEHFAIGLPVEPLAPNPSVSKPAGEHARGSRRERSAARRADPFPPAWAHR